MTKVDTRTPSEPTIFQYDARDRLVQVKQDQLGVETILGQYDYNHEGDRIRHRHSDRGDVDYYYDDGAVLEERNAADDSLLAYYQYADRLLALVQPQGTQYYHHDALGSTIGLTDHNGNAKKSYHLDPWGNIRWESGTSDNRYIFTGKEHDENTGLVYFGARYYDPEIGRFITQDTYLGDSNTPPSLHRYLYAYSNPTVFVDLEGYQTEFLPGYGKTQLSLMDPAALEAAYWNTPEGKLTVEIPLGLYGGHPDRPAENLVHLAEGYVTGLTFGLIDLDIPKALDQGLGTSYLQSPVAEPAQQVGEFVGSGHAAGLVLKTVGRLLRSTLASTATASRACRAAKLSPKLTTPPPAQSASDTLREKAQKVVRSSVEQLKKIGQRALEETGAAGAVKVPKPKVTTPKATRGPPEGKISTPLAGSTPAEVEAQMYGELAGMEAGAVPISRAARGTGPRLLTAGSRVPNAGGRIISFVTEEQRTFYRVFSGDSRVGSFLTSVKPKSSAFAREALALPPGNQATFVQEVIVPAGTRLQRSRALPAFGRRGGAEQFELLEHIPVENFGAGVPLP